MARHEVCTFKAYVGEQQSVGTHTNSPLHDESLRSTDKNKQVPNLEGIGHFFESMTIQKKKNSHDVFAWK